MELLAEFPITQISNALKTGKTIRLYAHCHGKYWDATFVERTQLREYLETATGVAQQCNTRQNNPPGIRNQSCIKGNL